MKKDKFILITGGAGYIGSHAVNLFLQKGYKVIIFDNLSRGFLGAIKNLQSVGDIRFVKGDLCDLKSIEKVFSDFHIDTVIHFAAFCSIDESVKDPGSYFSNNSFGTLNLIRAMRDNNVKKIIFSSTCAVYGETLGLPVDENYPTKPTNPYGESKLIAEKMLRSCSKSYKFYYVILRYFNVCGSDSDGLIGDSKKPSVHLVQNIIRGAMNIEPFSLTCAKVDTPDKTPIRDYVDVRDLAFAHYLAFEYLNKNNNSETFNLGNGKGFSVKEIIQTTEEILNVNLPQKISGTRKGEYAAIFADCTKVKRVLNWEPQYTLRDSILSLQKWYGKFPNGYEN